MTNAIEQEIKAGEVEVFDFINKETSVVTFPRGFHCTDDGNAERFLWHYAEYVRFCLERNTWYIWDETRYKSDTTGQIFELAKETVRLIHYEVGDILDKGERRQVSAWAFQSESFARIEAMLRYARTDERIAIEAKDLDADAWLINCQNGTLDLKARAFRPHDKHDLITKITAVEYDPESISPEWYERLYEVLDIREGAFLQRAGGSALTAINEDKAIFFLYGKPNARKSTLLEAMFKTFGDYASALDVSTFARSPHRAGGARPDLISLDGVRAGQCSEVPKKMKFNDAFLKAMTGANPRKARDNYEKGMRDVKPITKFFIETNFMPLIDFEDEAAFNRCFIIKFLNTIPLESCDPKIKSFLESDESAQKAIFAWLVQGCYDWQDYGLAPPPEVNAARVEYHQSMNPLASFVKAELIEEAGAYVKTSELFEAFKLLATKDEKGAAPNLQSFGAHLTKLGITSKHTKNGAVRLNVRLRGLDEFDDDGAEGDDVTTTRGVLRKFSHEDNLKKVTQIGAYTHHLITDEHELRTRLKPRLINKQSGAVSPTVYDIATLKERFNS